MSVDLRPGVAIAVMSAWLGAALLTAASVAPAAFAVLPTRTMAGNLVGRVLPVVLVAGCAVGVTAAVFSMGSRARVACAAGVTLACAVAQFAVTPRIARLRAEIGTAIDALPVDDARRLAFGRLHAISVAWLGVAMLAAAAFTILSLLASRQRT